MAGRHAAWWLPGGRFEGPQRLEDVGEDPRPRPVFGPSQGRGAGAVDETGGKIYQLGPDAPLAEKFPDEMCSRPASLASRITSSTTAC